MELEAVLQGHDSNAATSHYIDALAAELDFLLANLRQIGMVVERDSAPNPAAVNWVQAWRVLERLETLLAEDGARANEVWRESAPLLEAALGPAAIPLRQAIEGYDYEQALQTVRKTLADKG